jgi:hypothetical protein
MRFFLLISLLIGFTALGQGITIKDGTSSNLAGVDSNNNLKSNMPTTSSQAGYVRTTSDGTFPTTSGAFSTIPVTGAGKGRLKVGVDTLFLFDPIDGTSVQANIWAQSFTTTNMTIVQANSTITINNSASTTASSGASLFSAKAIQRPTSFPICGRWVMKVPNQTITNATMETGFFTYATQSTSASATISDGAYFRFTSAGLFAVDTFASADTISAALSNPSAGSFHTFMVCRKSTAADFYVDDVWQASNMPTNTQPAGVSTSHLPLAFRTWTSSSAASAAPELLIGEASVFLEDLNASKPWGEQSVAFGDRTVVENPVSTFVQTPQWSNSAAPATCTLSNTTACYGTGILGGMFVLTVGVAGAVTDYDIFAYQVPSGFDMYVTGVSVPQYYVSTAITAAPVHQWAVAINSSAASLATTDAAAGSGTAQTWSPRRLALGTTTVATTAGSVSTPAPVWIPFNPPLLVHGGRFFHLILRQPVCASCAAGVISGTWTVSGYFE